MRRHRARKAIAAAELTFTRPDWALFLHPEGLSQKAGCPRERLRAMVLKELVDNALDAGATATVDQLDPDTWAVTDGGRGLDRAQVVRLFAVDRPLASTKLVRRPTRGAIGNGLRVVTGGALASGGRLQVESRGARYVLDVDRATGATSVLKEDASDLLAGTRVTVAFGPALPGGNDDGWMARLALRCAGPAARPMLSHPSWYDAAGFSELARAAELGATVADLAALLGVRLDDARPAAEANLEDLLVRAGPPPRLLPLGAGRFPGRYAKTDLAGADGGLPVLVEAWATAERCPPSRGRGAVTLLANRSPVAAPARITRDSEGRLAIFGCNLAYTIGNVSAGGVYGVVVAVTSPAIPVVTEGKEPDLGPLWSAVEPALATAMRAAHRATRRVLRRGDIKEAAWEVMEQAYLHASAGNTLPAEARQIMYAARRRMADILGPDVEISDTYFTKTLLPDFVAAHPGLTEGWDVVYGARGALVEPHSGTRVPLGTVAVRDYLRADRGRGSRGRLLEPVGGGIEMGARPAHRYRTALFIEKEGFDPLLEKGRIRERFDCAILSTKGMSVVACRHLLDRLGRDGTVVLVAHDFDRNGLAIAHTLGHDTRRYEFEVEPEIVDVGLRLVDCEAMGLASEPAPDEGPGPDKLAEYGAARREIEFLCDQHRRVELNAMDSRQFLDWLEARLREHGAGKVVPPPDVLRAKAREALAAGLVSRRLARIEAQAWAEAAGAELPADLERCVARILGEQPELAWEQAVAQAVASSRAGFTKR